MEPFTLEHTPPMLASQGYASPRDLAAALGISRQSVYIFLKRVEPAPKSLKVGVKVYFEVAPILAYIKAGGKARARAPKGKRGGTMAERAGKAKK